MKDLLMFIVKAMVDSPENVKVNVVQSQQATILELYVESKDRGKIIGKQGKNASAIRHILNVAAKKENKRVILEIIED